MSTKILKKLEEISDEEIKRIMSWAEKIASEAVKDEDMRIHAFEFLLDFKMGLLQSKIASENS